ncbi:hypothetical protein VULLAG_LOCUS12488 [Vulpes lagopus]
MQGARHGTRSRVSRVTPRAEGGTKSLGHQGCPSAGSSLGASHHPGSWRPAHKATRWHENSLILVAPTVSPIQRSG